MTRSGARVRPRKRRFSMWFHGDFVALNLEVGAQSQRAISFVLDNETDSPDCGQALQTVSVTWPSGW